MKGSTGTPMQLGSRWELFAKKANPQEKARANGCRKAKEKKRISAWRAMAERLRAGEPRLGARAQVRRIPWRHGDATATTETLGEGRRPGQQ